MSDLAVHGWLLIVEEGLMTYVFISREVAHEMGNAYPNCLFRQRLDIFDRHHTKLKILTISPCQSFFPKSYPLFAQWGDVPFNNPPCTSPDLVR